MFLPLSSPGWSNKECQSDITLALGNPHLSSSARASFLARASESATATIVDPRSLNSEMLRMCSRPMAPVPAIANLRPSCGYCGGFFWTRRPCLASFSCEAAASSRSWARAWSRSVMVAFVGACRRRPACVALCLPCGSSLWERAFGARFLGPQRSLAVVSLQ